MTTHSTKPEKSEKTNAKGSGPEPSTGVQGARRTAGVILEVLAGTLKPSQAASALAVSVPRYYVLETRAMEGLVRGCAALPVGYHRTPEKELEALRKRQTKLENECTRYQSLLRASQRAVGLSIAREEPPPEKGRRPRRASVRALRFARKLQQGLALSDGTATVSGKQTP
jgi:hypothetical protein